MRSDLLHALATTTLSLRRRGRRPLVLSAAIATAVAPFACAAPTTDELAADTRAALSTAKHPLATPPMSTATDAFVGDFDGTGTYDVARWNPAPANDWKMGLSCGSNFVPETWAGDWGSDGPIHAGDLNGDGKSDLFMWRAAGNDWTVNLSTGTGFHAEEWNGDWGSDGPINVGDLNGDGKTDVFMWRAAGNDWTVNLSTGAGFNAQTWNGAWGSDGPINVGDLNGDGRTDVFMWRAAGNDWTVNLSTGSGFDAQVWNGDWGSDGPINVGDLNGDGKTDVFMWRAAGNDWTVNLSTGTGFTAETWNGDWGSDGPINVGDLNGDGKTDVFMWRGDTWTVNISTGTGFVAQEWPGGSGAGSIHVADVNGDHKDDVVVHTAQDTWVVNTSTGTGWISWGNWSSDPTGTVTIDSLSTTPVAGTSSFKVDYDVSFAAGCDPTSEFALFGSNGLVYQQGSFGVAPSGVGSVVIPNYPSLPYSVQVTFNCDPGAACYEGPGTTRTVSPPSGPKITSFTATPSDGPGYGRQCYGLKQTFDWNVAFPSSQCTKHAVSIVATDSDNGGDVFFTAKKLPDSGSITHVANTDAIYTLTATCEDDSVSTSSKITASIAPAADCKSDAGAGGGIHDAGTKGQTWCFKAVGLASGICTTDQIYQDNQKDALAEFQLDFSPTEYTDTSIACSTLSTACEQ